MKLIFRSQKAHLLCNRSCLTFLSFCPRPSFANHNLNKVHSIKVQINVIVLNRLFIFLIEFFSIKVDTEHIVQIHFSPEPLTLLAGGGGGGGEGRLRGQDDHIIGCHSKTLKVQPLNLVTSFIYQAHFG